MALVRQIPAKKSGARRLHKRANAAEIAACVRWLHAELEEVAPRRVVCLGAMAAKVVLGPAFELQQQRGRWFGLEGGRWAMATVHPSFVMRSRFGGGYDAARAAFVEDLRRLHPAPE